MACALILHVLNNQDLNWKRLIPIFNSLNHEKNINQLK